MNAKTKNIQCKINEAYVKAIETGFKSLLDLPETTITINNSVVNNSNSLLSVSNISERKEGIQDFSVSDEKLIASDDEDDVGAPVKAPVAKEKVVKKEEEKKPVVKRKTAKVPQKDG